jgi:hypothetical protein
MALQGILVEQYLTILAEANHISPLPQDSRSLSDKTPTDILLMALKDITRNRYGMQSIIEEHSDVNAFNYHAKKYYEGVVGSYRNTAFKALEAYTEATAALSDKDLFDRIAYESWMLRPVNVPSGGDDYLIHWQVLEHEGEGEAPVQVGYAHCDDPREAVRDAIRNRSKAKQP